MKWWFPGRYFGLQHKNAELEKWKRAHAQGAAVEWKRDRDGLRAASAKVADNERGTVGRPSGNGVKVVGFEPCFSVADVRRAVSHYEQLGFSSSYHDEGYAFAHRDNLTIHLAHGEQPIVVPSALYIHVDNADRLAEEWRAVGAEVVGPDDQDYGKREGSHVDPDGNLLRFGSPLRRGDA